MRKRSSTLPFFVFLALFVTPIAAAVLLANDARNQRELGRRVGIEWRAPADPAAAPTSEPSLQAANKAPPATQTMAKPPLSLEQQLITRPSETVDQSFSSTDPKLLCDGLARLSPRVAPQFSKAPGRGWDCTAQVAVDASDDVLFVQAKGEGLFYGSFRAKISLYDGRAIAEMAQLTAQALARFEPVDAVYVSRILGEALKADTDQDILLAHGTLVVRRERGEGRRYNIFVRPVQPREAPPTPPSGFSLDTPIGGDRS